MDATATIAGPDLAYASPHASDEQVRMIVQVSRLLAVPTDLDRLLLRIAEIACEMLLCERASIFLHDRATAELWTKVALKSQEIRVSDNRGIVGHTFTCNEVVVVPEPYQDPRFNREPDRRSGFVTRNLVSVPVKGLDGKPLGVIQVLNKVGGTFIANDIALLQLLADQGGVAVQRHQLQLDAVRSAELRREMDLARRAQEKLIPRSPPPIERLTSVGWTLPASITGGDCFDLWKLQDGRLGVLVADASGHGLAPAMIVAQARSLVRAMSDIQPDPDRVLRHVDRRLSDDLECGQFVTAFLGFVSSDGELQWSSAGHGPVLARTQPGAPLAALNPPMTPLGIGDAPEEKTSPIVLRPGGSLIVISDGIFEARNAARELFGVQRMTDSLNRRATRSPAEVLAGLRDDVQAWQGGDEPLDDQTIVIVQREA